MRHRFDWKQFPWHVFFFAAYPVIAMLANNITQVQPGVVWEPLSASLMGAIVLFLVFRLVFRNWQKAAILTTILVILFFSYGHIYSSLKGIQASGVFLFRHRTLVPVWIALAGIAIWWSARKKNNLMGITTILNVIGIGLLIYPGILVTAALWKQRMAFQAAPQSNEMAAGQAVEVDENQPDIYYIILDAYGRSDILDSLYGYDNSGFLANLEQQGFYVAHCSQSNYSQTELSLASSLNYNYLDILTGDNIAPQSTDRSPLWPLLKYSALRQFLESRNYKMVAFETGYYWSQITDADIYLTPISSGYLLNEFDYMLFQSTMGRILLDTTGLNIPDSSSGLARQRTISALAQLADMPSIEGPKFVFVHLIIPHAPFVFGPNGETVAVMDPGEMTRADHIHGYVDQTKYTNQVMEELVANIISKSSIPPIIIIQGDHGPTFEIGEARMGILNAYYLPEAQDSLYDSISPVNTFRVVLNAYFGQTLPLLPDASFYSTYQSPYDFQEIPNVCSEK
jgi:hypothetical protein